MPVKCPRQDVLSHAICNVGFGACGEEQIPQLPAERQLPTPIKKHFARVPAEVHAPHNHQEGMAIYHHMGGMGNICAGTRLKQIPNEETVFVYQTVCAPREGPHRYGMAAMSVSVL